jgi:hypothetical protein
MWGYLDGEGRVFVKPEFLTVAPFHAGWARVTLANGKTGFVDLRGKFRERKTEEVAEVATAAGK